MAKSLRAKTEVREDDLTRLREVAASAIRTPATISLKPEVAVLIVDELLRLREELFRIRVCETVDRIIEEDGRL